jgi:hypothetical protein
MSEAYYIRRQAAKGLDANIRREPLWIKLRNSGAGKMSVKKIRNQNTRKPKTKQIADLVDYIRRPHNTNPAEKSSFPAA